MHTQNFLIYIAIVLYGGGWRKRKVLKPPSGLSDLSLFFFFFDCVVCVCVHACVLGIIGLGKKQGETMLS